jgi:hypothetical protein
MNRLQGRLPVPAVPKLKARPHGPLGPFQPSSSQIPTGQPALESRRTSERKGRWRTYLIRTEPEARIPRTRPAALMRAPHLSTPLRHRVRTTLVYPGQGAIPWDDGVDYPNQPPGAARPPTSGLPPAVRTSTRVNNQR